MHYTIRHVTRFTYDAPISESVMEVRMQPRSELCQRCLRFELVDLAAHRRAGLLRSAGNIVHHFDIPGRHSQLTLTAEAIVEFVGCPDETIELSMDDWARIDAAAATRGAVGLPARQHVRPRHAACSSPSRPRSASGRAARSDDHAANAHPGDPRRPRVPAEDDARRFADRRGAREPRRGVPGFRAHHDCAGAAPRHSGALRQRLSVPRQRGSIGRRARRTPGSRRSCPASAGSASIPPTTSSPARATSASPSAATTPTCRRRAGSTRETRATSCRCRSTSHRPLCPRRPPICCRP